MTLGELVTRAHANAVNKGFWDSDVKQTVAGGLMVIVTELGEACEADRIGDRENFAEELADVIIRVADLCGGLGIDIEKAVEQKMCKNEGRPRLHGKRY